MFLKKEDETHKYPIKPEVVYWIEKNKDNAIPSLKLSSPYYPRKLQQ